MKIIVTIEKEDLQRVLNIAGDFGEYYPLSTRDVAAIRKVEDAILYAKTGGLCEDT